MTKTAQREMSQGEQLRQSEAVRGAIDAMVGELRERSASITAPRGPLSPELTKFYDELMAVAADVRGRPLLYPYIGSGLGNGALVELADGSVKFDMITGIGVQFFGHSDPDLVSVAVEAGLGDTVMQGHLMMNEEAIRFAEVLVGEAKKGSRLAHAFLCGSGAMANENALKVCMQKRNGAPRVIAFAHCFMGRSTTMAQIGDSAAGRQGLALNVMADYLPFYDHIAARRMSAGDVSGSTRYIDMCVWHLEQLVERYPDQHACFVFELVQGEGGFNTALPEFHAELMTVCKASNIPVWADEVQTFGRTEKMFCFDAMGLGEFIDVCTIGKMSQVCAALYTSDFNPKAGLLSGTFLGSAVGLKVGRRIMERLRDGDYYGPSGRIARHHALFREHVEALARKHPEWFPASHQVIDIAGGYGGMMRFSPFGGQKDPILKLCRVLYDEGVISFYCGHGPYHVRMLPPLGVMPESQWPEVFAIIERAMAKVHKDLPAQAAPTPRPMVKPYAKH